MVMTKKEYNKRYRESHKEYIKEYNQIYYYSHLEKIKKYYNYKGNKKYSKNPFKVGSLEWKQYYNKKSNLRLFAQRFGSAELREFVIIRGGGKCELCGITRQEHKEKYGKDITVDHIDGEGRGSKIPNNNPSNLRPLCLVCNIQLGRKYKKIFDKDRRGDL